MSAFPEEFDVVFDTNKPLGLRLDATLAVQGFQRAGPSKMPAESTGWIRVGDRLVAVNERRVENKALSDVQQTIVKADLPKKLRFSAVGGANRSSEMVDILDGPSGIHGHEGVVELWRDGFPLGTLPFLQAMFGGQTSCKPARLMLSSPTHGCFAHPRPPVVPIAGAADAGVADSLLVVTRGDCAFTIKASQAQSASAHGLIVINDEAGAIRMPATEPTGGGSGAHGKAKRGGGGGDEVVIPAVMVDAKDGAAIVRLLSEAAAAAASVQTRTPPVNGRVTRATDTGAKTSAAKPLLARFVRKGQVCKSLSSPVKERQGVRSSSSRMGGLAGEEAEDGSVWGGLGDPYALAGEMFALVQACPQTGGAESRAARMRALRTARQGADLEQERVAIHGADAHTSGHYVEEEDERGSDGLHHHVEGLGGTERRRSLYPGKGRGGGEVGVKALLAAREKASIARRGQEEEGGGSQEWDDELDEGGEGEEVTPEDVQPLQATAQDIHEADEDDTAALAKARALHLPLSPSARRAYLQSRPCSTGPIEYVRAGWSLPLPMLPTRMVLAVPANGCEALEGAGSQAMLGAAVLVTRGECPFGDKRSHVAAAGASLMIVSNDAPSAPLFSMTAVGDPPVAEMAARVSRERAGTGVRGGEGEGADPRHLPSVLVSFASGAALRLSMLKGSEGSANVSGGGGQALGGGTHQQSSAAPLPPGIMATLTLTPSSVYPLLASIGRPALAPLWEELAGLVDPSEWPEEAGARRRLYLRLSRLHHPDRSSGAADRFDLLASLYKRAQEKWDPQGGAAGDGEGWAAWEEDKEEL